MPPIAPALLAALLATQPSPSPTPAPPKVAATLTPITALVKVEELDTAIKRGVEYLVSAQEGDPNVKRGGDAGPTAEWPYEGVYRAGGQIPIGYRVGGTSIAGLALLGAPGYADDQPRREAIARAATFVCEAIKHPLMSVDEYDAGYDVRGWGYTFGALFLLDLKDRGVVPQGQGDAVEASLKWYLDAIERTQIPESGGWNYARPSGKEKKAAPSSFMTANTVQTLLRARASGYAVNEGTLTKALDFLEKARYITGAIAYSGEAGAPTRSDGVPGSVGRMCAVESTLLMAGRGSVQNVRAAVDAFLAHWDWLEQRRKQPGTHIPPFGVAPYYLMYAHRYAAQSVELLPPSERPEYRRRLNLLLWRVREDDGTWNDRQFKRSAGYGTAMAMLAMMEGRKP